MIATSRPLHAGRSIIVIETEVRTENDLLVAKVTQSQPYWPTAPVRAGTLPVPDGRAAPFTELAGRRAALEPATTRAGVHGEACPQCAKPAASGCSAR